MVDSITIRPAPTPAEAPKAPAAAAPAPVAPATGTPVNPGVVPKELAPAALNPTNAPAPKEPARPEWLPAKFKDAAQMAQAYAELEKKLGGGEAPKPAAEPAPVVDPTKPAAAVTPAPDGMTDVLKAAGFDYAKLTEEVQAKGDLSKETYDGLYAKFGKQVVDQHIAGMKASANQYSGAVQGFAGGAETYGKVMQWAVANVPAAEAKAYNEAVNSGDLARAKLAVDGIVSKYNEATGSEPTLITGDGVVKTSGDVYGSWAQVSVDMKDPRYAKDSAFRAKVEEKLARSPI